MNKKLRFITCILIGFLPSLLWALYGIDSAGSEWYNLNKPSFTPPNWLFGPVWGVLYLFIGISLFYAWANARKKEKKNVALSYGINLFLNALWSIAFFGARDIGLSLVIIFGIWISIILMMFVSFRIDKKAGWLLVPYLLWVSFAMILNLSFGR